MSESNLGRRSEKNERFLWAMPLELAANCLYGYDVPLYKLIINRNNLHTFLWGKFFFQFFLFSFERLSHTGGI